MEAHHLPKFTKKQKNVLVAAERKRFCDQKALHIVELLIEPVIDHAWLLHQLQFIDQHHYDDVTEERSCTGCCGYPLCANRLGSVPSHQFQISTNTNRIYDISERKKYCSNACFRASRHLKPQIQTSPLWMRDEEPPPVFRLLDKDNNRRGLAGDMVSLGVARAPADDPPPPPQMTTDEVATDMMHQFDELSEQIPDLGLKPQEESGKPEERGGEQRRRSCLRRPGGGAGGDGRETDGKTVQFGSVMDRRGDRTGEEEGESRCQTQAGDTPGGQPTVESTLGDGESTERDTDGSQSTSRETSHSQETEKGSEPPSSRGETPRSQETSENATKSPEPTPTQQTQPKQQQSPGPSPAAPTRGFKRPVRSPRRQQHPLKVVEARLLDWLSGRTPATAAVPVADPLQVEILTGGGSACLTDNTTAGGSGTANAAAVIVADAAVPTTVISPAEAAGRNRALMAYMHGQVRVPPAAPPRPAPAPAQDPAQQLTESGRPVPPEPLLESQVKQRRRIVNDQLSKATARLLSPLGLYMSDVASPLRQLVASFHLTALNVTMTPSQWTLAALALLRCLLRQNAELTSLARDVEPAFSRALQPLQLTPASLDRLVDRLVELLTGRPPGSAAGCSPGSAPGSAPNSIPGSAPGSAAGPALGSAAGPALGSAPGSAPGSGPYAAQLS